MITIEASGTKTVAFATHDQRETITTEHRKPDFVGYLRNMWGMGYPTGTTTQNPPADDMTTAVTSSLNAAGFTSAAVNVPFTDNHEAVQCNIFLFHSSFT